MIFLVGAVFTSCKNNGNTSKEAKNDSSKEVTAAKMNYPYTIDHPDNWETGSTENTMNALSGLKAFENGNIVESMKYFGDSVHLMFDGLDTTLPNDSVKAMFTKARGNMKSLDIKMYDWESVISKDKKDEYVTVWYRQKWSDTNGKTDSLSLVNDLKMRNGKIIELSEYSRKLH